MGKENTKRRINKINSALSPQALQYTFQRFEGKRKLLFRRHTKPTHILEMYEREDCQAWTECKRSLNLRGFGAAAHTVASVAKAPTLMNELL